MSIDGAVSIGMLPVQLWEYKGETLCQKAWHQVAKSTCTEQVSICQRQVPADVNQLLP